LKSSPFAPVWSEDRKELPSSIKPSMFPGPNEITR
jgi:hypothetical protein